MNEITSTPSSFLEVPEKTSVEVRISDLFQQSNLEGWNVHPSRFQRGYSWSSNTALEFIRNVAKGNNHKRVTQNIGTAVLYRDKDAKKIEIVDGQQRAVTLLLFAYALEERRKDGEKLIRENSFFSRLEAESDDPEEKFELSSKLQMIRNLFEIREWLSAINDEAETDEAKKNDYVIEDFEDLSICFYITENKQEALDYYINSNTRGVKLTAGQLVKAYHYDCIGSDLVSNKNDPRYVLEAWRRNLLKNRLAETPFSLKPEQLKSTADLKFISPPYPNDSEKFSLENFIANNDWNDAWKKFQGLFNTFQLFLYSNDLKDNSFALPILHESQSYPNGLDRLLKSDPYLSQCNDRNFLNKVMFVDSGWDFFLTVDNLLTYYRQFADEYAALLKKTDSFQDNSLRDKSDWSVTPIKVLNHFREDYETLKDMGIKDFEDNFINVADKALKTGFLLGLFCTSLSFHHRFINKYNDEQGENPANHLRNILFASIWSVAATGKLSWDKTQIEAGGFNKAASIIFTSPSALIAEKRMFRYFVNNLEKFRKLKENIEQNNQSNTPRLPSIEKIWSLL